MLCPVGDLNIVPTLRPREKPQKVWLLNAEFHWLQADLVVAHCASCRADYYPDSITYRSADGGRRQKLEMMSQYIRVSKHGIWVDRQIARFQESAVNRLQSGWSNFADWINDSTRSERKLTYRQSHRLFVEHPARRLLCFHEKDADFSCSAHPSTKMLSESVRATVGVNGGSSRAAMTHGCVDCTHIKRYHSDLVEEGAILGGDIDVVGMPPVPNENLPAPVDPAIAQLPAPQQQEVPPVGEPRGYLRLAVMDGKSIKHRKCALDTCEGPLGHLNLKNVCGIIPCGRPVVHPGALTCDMESHIAWHRQYESRFSRLSFPGVHRVMRRQQGLGDNDSVPRDGNPTPTPALRVELDTLGDTPGNQNICCLQTIQWSCGFPISWGKCYRSESSPQVVRILDRIWEDYPDAKPGFIAYDDACSLLRYIFIVDAWHYIGHCATDILCRIWCNPALVNGSQPDLVIVQQDAHGTNHQTRTFNTETAEQLNSWLSGFESKLRQMSDVNSDFFVHVLMLIYSERVEKRIAAKGLELSEEFWIEATGN
ncbi:hypothetical protein K438DRAFT_1907877 [Mycena galopus ATCC 62051]|nr:hypothetical protein K438DRAFT_1907877 [Mycena galopus ATCC 62051]